MGLMEQLKAIPTIRDLSRGERIEAALDKAWWATYDTLCGLYIDPGHAAKVACKAREAAAEELVKVFQ